jgi:hypothetical protein
MAVYAHARRTFEGSVWGGTTQAPWRIRLTRGTRDCCEPSGPGATWRGWEAPDPGPRPSPQSWRDNNHPDVAGQISSV